MPDSDPSKALIELLDRLPPHSTVGLADQADPADPASGPGQHELVLGVGLDRAGAERTLRAAARAGSAAVVLRGPAEPALVELAAGLELALLWLAEPISWRALHRGAAERLAPPTVRGDDELADLAQTIAVLTGGLVTIEDTSARVLAYSRSSDEVDELRRLSILGRSGPPAYLALLREWGVYDRLAAAEQVVEIAEHPDSGIRRRLAVGVFAGHRQLGTIWVQQGATEFGPHARQALLGAARLTAVQLASQGPRPARRGATELLAGALAGRGSGLPAQLGRSAGKPCAIAVFALPAAADPEHDQAAETVGLDELAAIVTVHAAAFRRDALATVLAGRVYLLLPGLDSMSGALELVGNAVAAVRRHLDPGARAALGSRVESVAGIELSRRAADLALGVAGELPVLGFDAARGRLITGLAENALAQQPELIDPRVRTLVQTDPDGARTLLDYLDSGSDVGRVAAGLGIHPTTVRYRVRRAVHALELDLAETEARLASQLQLRCGLRSRAKER